MVKRSLIGMGVALLALVLGVHPTAAQEPYPQPENFFVVDDTTVVPGQTIEVTVGTTHSGALWVFTFTPPGTVLATETAGADGTVTTTLTIPSDATPGAHTITAEGDGVSVSIEITVVGAEAAAVVETRTLPFTGRNSTRMAWIGGILMLAGGAAVVASRRRSAQLQREYENA